MLLYQCIDHRLDLQICLDQEINGKLYFVMEISLKFSILSIQFPRRRGDKASGGACRLHNNRDDGQHMLQED
jgi:hypothetical protein